MTLDTVLSIMVLGCLAMVLGAFALWRRRGATRQVWLMLVLAVVLAGNVAIWLVPDGGGQAPVKQELK